MGLVGVFDCGRHRLGIRPNRADNGGRHVEHDSPYRRDRYFGIRPLASREGVLRKKSLIIRGQDTQSPNLLHKRNFQRGIMPFLLKNVDPDLNDVEDASTHPEVEFGQISFLT